MAECIRKPNVSASPRSKLSLSFSRLGRQQIVQTHLIGGAPVQRLVFPKGCVNTPRCPHRGGGVQLGGV